MRISIELMVCGGLMMLATPAQAQGTADVLDAPLVAVAASALDMKGAPILRESRTVVIPTAILYLSLDGSMRASSQSSTGAAIVSFDYQVSGLQKATVQDVAIAAVEDLAERLRTQGMTVLRYDDVKTRVALQQVERHPSNATYGIPTVRDDGLRVTYAAVAPTDDQAMNVVPKGSVAGLRLLANELGAVVVIPELWLNAPTLERERNFVFGKLSARVTVSQRMDLQKASLTIIGPSGATGTVRLKEPVTELAPLVGVFADPTADSSRFGGSSAADVRMLGDAGLTGLARGNPQGGNAIAKHRVQFVVTAAAYTRSVLRGASSFFHVATTPPAKK